MGGTGVVWRSQQHWNPAHFASLFFRFVSRIFVVPDHPELLLSSSGVSATLPRAPLGSSVVTGRAMLAAKSLSFVRSRGLEVSVPFSLVAGH